jgi:protein involved in polysaccharide export with SLBB domain
MLSFNVSDVLSGSLVVPVKAQDTILLYSKSEIHQPYFVYVHGEVNHEDSIPYADGMQLEDAILMSGGFTDAASWKEIEVARRTTAQNYDSLDFSRAIVRKFSIPGNFSGNADTPGAFTLEPFDLITVRRAPGYQEQATVKLEGEVVYPGEYVLDSRDEKLSDLVKKTGGTKNDAYLEGALLLRKKTKDEADKILEQNKLNIFTEANKGDDSLELRKLGSTTGNVDYELVDIDLRKALESPGSKYDLLLQKGDIIRIPLRLETVTLNGEVFFPKQVRFDESYSFKDFVLQAGGFTANALRKKSYVVYPNGEVRGTKKIFIFGLRYPKIKPGSEIFVPAKRRRQSASTAEIIGITTGIAALLGIIISIINITK